MHFEPATVAPETQQGGSLWLVFQDARLLVSETDLASPILRDAAWLGMAELFRHYLGSLNGQGVYAVAATPDAQAPAGYRFEDLRRLLGQIDDRFFALAGRAFQILEWDRSHRFCGRCGSPTVPHAQGERARLCPACEISSYPRINPCVIVAVTRGEEILLARAQRFNRPLFSTLAGFIEAGETAEETLHREVLEEVGVRVRNLRYFGSQSWPFPGNLMLGFHAEYAGGELVLQEAEIAEAAFFHYSRLPVIPPPGSIAHGLIEDFVMRCQASRR